MLTTFDEVNDKIYFKSKIRLLEMDVRLKYIFNQRFPINSLNFLLITVNIHRI